MDLTWPQTLSASMGLIWHQTLSASFLRSAIAIKSDKSSSSSSSSFGLDSSSFGLDASWIDLDSVLLIGGLQNLGIGWI